MRGFYKPITDITVRFLLSDIKINILYGAAERTLLKDDMASTTSFVKVFPTPEDPISTVGLIA